MEPASSQPWMDRDAFDALRWVNAQRARIDLPLLLHLPAWDGCVCPLEVALRPVRVTVRGDGSVWCYDTARVLVMHLPAGAKSFLEKLDRGFYPALGSIEDAEACPAASHRARCEHGEWAARRRAA